MFAWKGVPGGVLGLTLDPRPDGFPNILHSSAQPHPSGGLIIDKESEVYKMLQEKQELNEPPKQSTSFLVLQEILESDGKGKCPRGQSPSLLEHGCAQPTLRAQLAEEAWVSLCRLELATLPRV